MVLISEHQYENIKNKNDIDFSPIMNSNLTTRIKVKMIDQLMMKEDIKKEKIWETDEKKLQNEIKEWYKIYQDLKNSKFDEDEYKSDDSSESFHTTLDHTYDSKLPNIDETRIGPGESSKEELKGNRKKIY